jgi:hypothetical protein
MPAAGRYLFIRRRHGSAKEGVMGKNIELSFDLAVGGAPVRTGPLEAGDRKDAG